MAIFNAGRAEKGNFLQGCLDPTLLQAAKPATTKGTTIFRPIPEVAPDGSILSMVNRETPSGLDIANLLIEKIAFGMGGADGQRFSGFTRASDRETEKDWDEVFPGLYIMLKGRLKRNKFESADMELIVRRLFEGVPQPLGLPDEYGMVQGIITTFNNEALEKPRSKQVMFLTWGVLKRYVEVITEAYHKGIDVFDPKEGRAIILEPEEIDGKKRFKVRLSDAPVPVAEETCKALWVPWEGALKLRTFDEHVKSAVGCYGAEIVKECFPDDVNRLATPVVAPANVEVEPKPAAVVVEKVEKPGEAPAALQVDISIPAEPLQAPEDAPVEAGNVDAIIDAYKQQLDK